MARLIIGCGYLGSRVAPYWRLQGGYVTARTESRRDELKAQGFSPWPLPCDVLDPEGTRRCMQSIPPIATVVYAVGFDRTLRKSMREVYVGGLSNVLTWLRPPWRFIYVSSTSVYGQTAGEEVDETSATDPTDESGQVMLEAERLLRERLPEAIILRFAGIYGPGRLIRSQSLLKGEPIPADPEGWLNLIQVEDGAAAVVAANERGQPGATYNIADDRPVQRREFYTRLADLLGAPAARFVPPPNGGATNRRISNRRMRAELNVALRYPSFEEGLRAGSGLHPPGATL
jgi:nucleoside-diphosphate-sugar epimerase